MTEAKSPRIDRSQYLQPSASETDAGNLIGRDPREMPIEDLAALGHTSPIKAVRAKCLDCTGNQPSEVRKCTAVSCPLWAFRMGKNLFRGKASSNAGADGELRESSGFQDEVAQ